MERQHIKWSSFKWKSHLESNTANKDYSTIQNLPYKHAPLDTRYTDLFQIHLSENCLGNKLSKMHTENKFQENNKWTCNGKEMF